MEEFAQNIEDQFNVDSLASEKKSISSAFDDVTELADTPALWLSFIYFTGWVFATFSISCNAATALWFAFEHDSQTEPMSPGPSQTVLSPTPTPSQTGLSPTPARISNILGTWVFGIGMLWVFICYLRLESLPALERYDLSLRSVSCTALVNFCKSSSCASVSPSAFKASNCSVSFLLRRRCTRDAARLCITSKYRSMRFSVRAESLSMGRSYSGSKSILY
mmetsp:Transcript_14257/g.23757  ORF Transcript_14257/g.23757 Transcript_14257/m.23757 type:complete len:221 (-) Transcript_14257:1181-1843(-)